MGVCERMSELMRGCVCVDRLATQSRLISMGECRCVCVCVCVCVCACVFVCVREYVG